MNGKAKKERAKQLTDIAIRIAEKSSYINVNHEDIANEAKMSTASVYYVLGTRSALHEIIVKAAIETENVTIVAQALALKNPLAVEAPDVLKARAVQLLGTF